MSQYRYRQIACDNKRLSIYHPDDVLREALFKASWELNPIGMSEYHKGILMFEKKKEFMTMENGEIVEKYVGRKSHGLVRTYQTETCKCSCSCFKSHLFCRHQLFYQEQNGLPMYQKEMFNKLFLNPGVVHSGLEDEQDYETVQNSKGYESNVEDNTDDLDQSPPSPGMEVLLEEEKEVRRRPAQNEKYHKSFDAAKVLTELLPQFEKERFDNYLKASHNFIKLLRNDIPEHLLEYLSDPEKYDLTLTLKSSEQVVFMKAPECSEPSNTNKSKTRVTSSLESSQTTDTTEPKTTFFHTIKPSLPSKKIASSSNTIDGNLYEVKPEHKAKLDQTGQDLVFVSIPANGACFYSSAAQFLYGDFCQSEWLRKEAHQFMINCFPAYYAGSQYFPVTLTIGTGNESYEKIINDEKEFMNFL